MSRAMRELMIDATLGAVAIVALGVTAHALGVESLGNAIPLYIGLQIGTAVRPWIMRRCGWAA